jgi:DNA polymerase-3 subunit delta
MRGEAKSLGVSLDEPNAKDIFQVVGGNLYRLANELRKLSIYVGKGGTLSRDKWTQVLTVSSIAEPWEIAEWAADKRPQKALNGLAALYKNGADDPAVPLAYALMKQAERLLVARTMLDKGATDEDVAVRFGMNPWRCKNSLIPMAKKHTAGKLVDLMGRLCLLDIQMKTSGPSKRTQLELTILTFAS